MLCALALKTLILFVTCDFYNDGSQYLNVSAADAMRIAEDKDMLLPTTEVVDAIYEQATCRIYTPARDPASQISMQKQSEYAMRKRSSCNGEGLISGHYKSIVRSGDQIGLYGWYTKDGGRIQNFFSGHAIDYVDYSQALRLVSKMGFDTSTGKYVVISSEMLSILQR